MNKLERLALVVLLGGAMLWVAWVEIGEGAAPRQSWPWAVLAAALMGWFVWRLGGRDLPQWIR